MPFCWLNVWNQEYIIQAGILLNKPLYTPKPKGLRLKPAKYADICTGAKTGIAYADDYLIIACC